MIDPEFDESMNNGSDMDGVLLQEAVRWSLVKQSNFEFLELINSRLIVSFLFHH